MIPNGRVSSPVGRAAFKAVEVGVPAWWVRLLPLPPNLARNTKLDTRCPTRKALTRLIAIDSLCHPYAKLHRPGTLPAKHANGLRQILTIDP